MINFTVTVGLQPFMDVFTALVVNYRGTSRLPSCSRCSSAIFNVERVKVFNMFKTITRAHIISIGLGIYPSSAMN